MSRIFADISQEDLEDYALLLDKTNDEIKKELHQTCKDYYLSYLFNDAVKFNVNADKLNEYYNFNIDAINDYLNYSLLIVINTLIEKMYNVKGYSPVNPGFEIERYKEKQAKRYIKELALSPGEVSQTIEYNKQSIDLWVLRDIANVSINVKPNIDLPKKVVGTGFANITYLGGGEDEIYNTAKMFYGLGIALDTDKKNDFKRWFDGFNEKS